MVALINDVLRNSQLPRRRQRQAALYQLGAAVAHAVAATLATWQRRSRERRELALLDARELKDIGLTHAEAQWLADRPIWRD